MSDIAVMPLLEFDCNVLEELQTRWDIDLKYFLFMLCQGPSLDKNEKLRVIGRVRSLSPFQVSELVRIFREEICTFQVFSIFDPSIVNSLVKESNKIWKSISVEELSKYKNGFELIRSVEKYKDSYKELNPLYFLDLYDSKNDAWKLSLGATPFDPGSFIKLIHHIRLCRELTVEQLKVLLGALGFFECDHLNALFDKKYNLKKQGIRRFNRRLADGVWWKKMESCIRERVIEGDGLIEKHNEEYSGWLFRQKAELFTPVYPVMDPYD